VRSSWINWRFQRGCDDGGGGGVSSFLWLSYALR